MNMKWTIRAVIPVILMSQALSAERQILSISIEQVQSNCPCDVQLRTDIKNTSAHDVIIGKVSPVREYAITAMGPDGKPAPETAFARWLRSSMALYGGDGVEITLAAAQMISETWNLSRLVDFSMPGTYRVTITSVFGSIKERDSSNTIEIKIP